MRFLHGAIVIMNLQWFDDLATVQETGHFSLAAQKLHISQPALSDALRHWKIGLDLRLLIAVRALSG